MPKNKGKGGKNRKRGVNKNEPTKRELILKEPGQEYAQCLKMLGNGRIEALCFDGKKRLATIRGKMRKKVWVNCGDIVLLGLRDFQEDKADVVLKYTPEEARKLQKKGHIPESAKINEDDPNAGEEGWDYDDDAGGSGPDSEQESSDDMMPHTDSEDSDEEESDDDAKKDAKPADDKPTDAKAPAGKQAPPAAAQPAKPAKVETKKPTVYNKNKKGKDEEEEVDVDNI